MRSPSLKILPALVLAATSLIAFSPAVAAQSNNSDAQNIPTIDFCEIVKGPHRYYDRTVRIEALWESGHEFSYLSDVRCPPRFRHEIAVGLPTTGPLGDEIRAQVHKIQSREYAGRALIRAVGILQKPGRYYGYYRYQFQILRIEEIKHVIHNYSGQLEAGKTYRAVVRGDKNVELKLIPPLHLIFHQSVGIDWTNLSEFPALEKLRENSGERQIIFSVLSDERRQMTESRWSRMLECKIIRIELSLDPDSAMPDHQS